jgi:hypothetical protein
VELLLTGHLLAGSNYASGPIIKNRYAAKTIPTKGFVLNLETGEFQFWNLIQSAIGIGAFEETVKTGF